MDLNSIVAKIPTIVVHLFDDIFVVNKSDDRAFHVQYTPDKLKVDKTMSYEEFKHTIDEYQKDVHECIEENERIIIPIKKENDAPKILWLETEEEVKYIFILKGESEKNCSGEKMMILVADDSPVITKFFERIFKDQYEVLIAKDGDEAIKLIEENLDKPLIGAFLDLQMPIKTGYQVLDYLKEHNLFSKVPISVISGEDSADGIARVTGYDIVDMLQKPFSADAARAIVEKTVRFSDKNN